MKNNKLDPRRDLAMNMLSIIYMNSTMKFTNIGVAPQRQAVTERLNLRANLAIKSKSPQNKKLQTVKISQLGKGSLWQGLDNVPDRKSKSPGNQQRLITSPHKQALSPQQHRNQTNESIKKNQKSGEIKINQNSQKKVFQRNHNRNGQNQANSSRYIGQTTAKGNIVSQNLAKNQKSVKDDFNIADKSLEKRNLINNKNQLNTISDPKIKNKSITQSRAIEQNKQKKVIFSPQRLVANKIQKKQPINVKPINQVKKYQPPAKNISSNKNIKQQPYVYVPPQKRGANNDQQHHSQAGKVTKNQTSASLGQKNLQYRSLSPKKQEKNDGYKAIQIKKNVVQDKNLSNKSIPAPKQDKNQIKKQQNKIIIQNKCLPYNKLSPEKQQKKVQIKVQIKKQIPKIQKNIIIKQNKVDPSIKTKQKTQLNKNIQNVNKQHTNMQKSGYVYQPPQKKQVKDEIQHKQENKSIYSPPKKPQVHYNTEPKNNSLKNIAPNQKKPIVIIKQQTKIINTPIKKPIQTAKIVTQSSQSKPTIQEIQRRPTIKPTPRQTASYSSIQFQQVSQIKKKVNNQKNLNVSLHISSKQTSPNKNLSISNASAKKIVNFSTQQLKKDWNKIKTTLKYDKSLSPQSNKGKKNVPQRQDVAMKMLAQIFLNASTRYFPGLSMLLKRGISKQQIQAIRSKSSQFKINILSTDKQKKSPVKPKTERKLNWVQSPQKNKEKQNNRVYQGDVTATQYKIKKQQDIKNQQQKSKASIKGHNIVKQNLQKNNRKVTRDDFLVNKNQRQPSQQSKSIRQSPDIFKRQVSQKDVQDSKKQVLKMKQQVNNNKNNVNKTSYQTKNKQQSYVYQPPSIKKIVDDVKPSTEPVKIVPTASKQIIKKPSPPKQSLPIQKIEPVKKIQNSNIKNENNLTNNSVNQNKKNINSGQNNSKKSIQINKPKIQEKKSNTLINSKSQPSLWNQTQIKKQIQKNVQKPNNYNNKTNQSNISTVTKNNNSSTYVYQPPNPFKKDDNQVNQQTNKIVNTVNKTQPQSVSNNNLKNVQSQKNLLIKTSIQVAPKVTPIVNKPVSIVSPKAYLNPITPKNQTITTSKATQKPVEQSFVKKEPTKNLINSKSNVSIQSQKSKVNPIKQASLLSKKFGTLFYLIIKKKLTSNLSDAFNNLSKNSHRRSENIKLASYLSHNLITFYKNYEILRKREAFNTIKKSILNSIGKIKSQKPEQNNSNFSSGRKQSASRLIFWLLKNKLSSYFQPIRAKYLKIANKGKNKSQVIEALIRIIQKRAYLNVRDSFKKIRSTKNEKKQKLQKFAAALNKMKYNAIHDHFTTFVNKDLKQLGNKAKNIKTVNSNSLKNINVLKSQKSPQKNHQQINTSIKLNATQQTKIQNKRKEFQRKVLDSQKRKQNLQNSLNQLNLDKKSFTKKNSQLKVKLRQIQKQISTSQALLPSQQKDVRSNHKQSLVTQLQVVPLLTKIYAYLFQDDKNQISIQKFLSDNQQSFQLATNPSLLNEWKLLMKNAQLKKLIKKYEGQQPRQKKINEIVNEQNLLMSKLLRSFIRQRYIWQWVNIIANQ